MTTTIDNKKQTIKNILETLYKKYNHRNLIKPDPLQFIYNYSDRRNMEIAGLLSAMLAYGRVEQIQKSLTRLLGFMGDNPSEFVLSFNQAKRKILHDFKHRFNTGDDISDLLELLRIVLKKHGSIENYFLQGYRNSDENIIPALSEFCNSLLNIHASKHNGKVNKGLEYLLVSPSRGSACKRLNLFLRWMVRDDEVDAGIWKSVNKAKLIVPIDVHMGRLCGFLGFHDKKNISLKTAIKITEHFSDIEPNDPVKYDFALSRIGIVENCTGKYSDTCKYCELNEFCRRRFS
ncbi:MAG: TIGR02757 family protein [Sedimentisphaerales bacterium]|nr:TIGR02757 family protein [Sedimentisphaerales bacterium]